MRAYEYPVKVSPEGKLELPDTLLEVLIPNQMVRVIILMSETSDAEGEANWSKLTAERFLAGYNEADAAYDDI